MKTIYFITGIIITVFLYSCESNNKNKENISGVYSGRIIYLLKLSESIPYQQDSRTEKDVKAFVDFSGDQPFININGEPLIVCGIKEYKDKISFNIKEQLFMEDMKIHGSSGIEDSDGNKFDGMCNLTDKTLIFGIEGTMSYQEGTGSKIDTPVEIAFELKKL